MNRKDIRFLNNERPSIGKGGFTVALERQLRKVRVEYEREEDGPISRFIFSKGKVGILEAEYIDAADGPGLSVVLRYPLDFDETTPKEDWVTKSHCFYFDYSNSIMFIANMILQRKIKLQNIQNELEDHLDVAKAEVKEERTSQKKKEKKVKRSREELEQERKLREKELKRQLKAKEKETLLDSVGEPQNDNKGSVVLKVSEEVESDNDTLEPDVVQKIEAPQERTKSNVRKLEGTGAIIVQYTGQDAKKLIFFLVDTMKLGINDEDYLKRNSGSLRKQLSNVITFLKIAGFCGCNLSISEREFLVHTTKEISMKMGITEYVEVCDSLLKSEERTNETLSFSRMLKRRLNTLGIHVACKNVTCSNSIYLMIDWGLLGIIRVSDHKSNRSGLVQSIALYAHEYTVSTEKALDGSEVINYSVPCA